MVRSILLVTETALPVASAATIVSGEQIALAWLRAPFENTIWVGVLVFLVTALQAFSCKTIGRVMKIDFNIGVLSQWERWTANSGSRLVMDCHFCDAIFIYDMLTVTYNPNSQSSWGL